MFALDIETLSDKENAVVLSAAIVYFTENDSRSYNEMIDDCCFIKFSVKEQVEVYKRIVTSDTYNWWKTQNKIAWERSVVPTNDDLTLVKGIDILKQYIKKYSLTNDEAVWTRGSLDQFCMDSICKDSLKIEPLFKYGQYVDFRTAIQLMKKTAKRGYCEIEGFDKNQVIKHDPCHDICYDIFMLLKGT